MGNKDSDKDFEISDDELTDVNGGIFAKDDVEKIEALYNLFKEKYTEADQRFLINSIYEYLQNDPNNEYTYDQIVAALSGML